ncbi:MAG: arginine repressor [Clostridia bacterium]
MIRATRQSKILSLIASRDIETQEELAKLLIESGYPVTQATISRDIKELGLIKTTSEANVSRYITISGIDTKISSKLLNILRETVISIIAVNNFVSVTTLENSGNIVSNIIKQLSITEILGRIEGNDCVLLVSATSQDAIYITNRLENILK